MSIKPSERIVVFVTPAQKLAISNAAEGLGISVSELMRRAVLNFNATSEQIKVAGLVDRLRAPKTPDALNVALRNVAEKAAAREAKTAAANASKNAAAAHMAALAKAKPEAEPPDDGESVEPGDSDEGASLTGGHSEQ
ncbi:hypothetical protein AWB81_03141 [Caballeronia arationis]|jgi:hypothetical protein|uniref:Ribbon-helix-helix protein, copG family n=1 Tax=Caballeronia arationis TaxID=1777142 RepID=A0A7Z7N415_9BURK|nr:hypothetical protein AWB81_03141 [Caballeronia arationis]SOE81564.1 hypothetical protein SAMN05446927_4850 [Caballeronia arationis]